MEGEIVYSLKYEKGFVRDLRPLTVKIKQVIKRKLEWLASNAQSVSHTSLRNPRFKGLYRLRVGDYRVFYRLDHRQTVIFVIAVKH